MTILNKVKLICFQYLSVNVNILFLCNMSQIKSVACKCISLSPLKHDHLGIRKNSSSAFHDFRGLTDTDTSGD